MQDIIEDMYTKSGSLALYIDALHEEKEQASKSFYSGILLREEQQCLNPECCAD